MKNKLIIASVFAASFAFVSCKKCAECHYDGAGGEVELGEFCDDDLENVELNGHHDHDADTTYEVHCHEH